MEKKTAISVFNFYNINPTNEEDLKSFDYRRIKKIKVNKKKLFKGEKNMQNTTLITKETPAPQMSFVERETSRLNKEIEELKNKLEIDTISQADYENALKRKNKQDIIDAYNEQQKIKEEITKKEKELHNLTPFQVGADIGKYNSKIAYVLEGNKTFVTDISPSRVQRATECRHDGAKKFFVGRELYVTSGNAKRVSDRDSVTMGSAVEPMNHTKAHEYHRVLLLKALYNVYCKTGRRVFNVGVGTSIDNYIEDNGSRVYLTMLDEKLPEEEQAKIDEAKNSKEINDIYKSYAQKLEQKFITKEFVVRETGGEPVTLVINDLYVRPETITGATKVNIPAEDLVHAYVLDIGGLNETYLPLVGCAPRFDNVISLKKGMAHKYEEIADWIVTKSSNTTAMDRGSVEAMLNNKETLLDKETELLIKDYMFTYLNEVTDRLRRNAVSLKEGVTTLIFIGGGSQVLAPYIKEYYSTVCDMKGKVHIAEKDGIFSNVTGIYDAATNYFDDRKYAREMNEHAC